MQPQEIIELLDDSPIPLKKTKAVFTASNKHVRISQTQRFQRYTQYSVAELVQQMITQKTQQSSSSRRPQTNIPIHPNRTNTKLITESYQTTITIWRRTIQENGEQIDCRSLKRVSFKLQNRAVTDLDDFIHNSLLNQVREWRTSITKDDKDKLYLAKRVEPKQTPVELPMSADNVRTVKEAMEFFSIINKKYIIHIIIERIELDPLEQLKQELSDIDSINIKKEKIKKEKIKKEKNTELIPRTESESWRIIKFKNIPPPVEPESSAESHKRVHSSTDDSFDRSPPELDQILYPSTPKAKKSKKKIKCSEKKKSERKKGKKRMTEEMEEMDETEEEQQKEEEEEEEEQNQEEQSQEEVKEDYTRFYSPPVLRIKKKTKNMI
ncbi:hypothetical protein GJ744_006446 [Endocarpon pusillum]|uniref:Uncharacterized protein n=1 Tax=Endocarpon pusillum TaxID=364733 RepID=A0A8H7DWR4_9EURO|nr:hypothetical protein GJ744_006446 [Endocarpon pusillum]